VTQVAIDGDVRIGAPSIGLAAPDNVSKLFDADTDGIQMCVQLPEEDGLDGTIAAVLFRFGTVTTKLNLTCSLETMGTDGLASGNYGGSAAGTKLTTDGDYATNTTARIALGTSATATPGDKVVFKIVPVAGSISININAVTGSSGQGRAFPNVFWNSTGSYVLTQHVPMLAFEYSDGSIRVPKRCFPPCTISTLSIQDDTDPDEAGWKITAPAAMTLAGIEQVLREFGTTANISARLYSSVPTLLQSITFTHDQINSPAQRPAALDLPQQLLTKDAVYYVQWYNADATNNLTLNYIDVDDATHWGGFCGGQSWHWASRVDGGAFTALTTRKPLGGLLFSKIDDGVGGGGGGASWYAGE
jgi:hypothetical protein